MYSYVHVQTLYVRIMYPCVCSIREALDAQTVFACACRICHRMHSYMHASKLHVHVVRKEDIHVLCSCGHV